MVRRIHEAVRTQVSPGISKTSAVPLVKKTSKRRRPSSPRAVMRVAEEDTAATNHNPLTRFELAEKAATGKYTRDASGGISRTGIRNVGYAAGVRAMSEDAHWGVLLSMKTMAWQITRRATLIAQYQRRNTVNCADVDLALSFTQKKVLH